MSKVFVIDVARCNGCRNCQIACKDEHCGTDWLPYAAAQPETGQFWMKVDEKERGTTPKVRVSYLPHGCMHCADAPCIAAAKDEAVYRRDDGLVVIDPQKAKSQKGIVDACPYHAVFWNDELEVPQKCTGCAHLLDDGWKVPRCVDACPTGALRFGEEEDFAAEVEATEVLQSEDGTSPRVYYLNLPKRFVAGEVYDPALDEVVIGAKVLLAHPDGSLDEVESDDFGDFWFEQVEPAVYTVRITAEGFEKKIIEVDATDVDVNIGAIALENTKEV